MTSLPLDESTDLALDREFRAPRERVWAALTDPTALDRWWGPSGFRTVTEAYDLRPGGAWRMTMHGPDGHAYPNHAIFDVVEPPVRLVLRYVDGSGDVHHVTTIRLDALGPELTRLTLALRFPSAAARKDAVERIGAVEGGRQTLARLAAHLEGTDRGVFRIQRLFAATPERLWSLWTDADHLARWFHPSAWTITRAELDLRVGGSFRYAFAGPDLPETGAIWRFTALEAPRRLAFELSFADETGAVAPSPFGGPWPERLATTVHFERHAGIGRGTMLTIEVRPLDASAEEVAAFQEMSASMTVGWGETLDALATEIAEEAPAGR